MAPRQFDILIFGATGFTGRRIVQHLATEAGFTGWASGVAVAAALPSRWRAAGWPSGLCFTTCCASVTELHSGLLCACCLPHFCAARGPLRGATAPGWKPSRLR